MHGGGAPQVQLKAKERLAALVDPAIDRLSKLLKTKQDKVALGAVKDVLDRNGFKPKDTTVHEGSVTIEQVLDAKRSVAGLLDRLAERTGADRVDRAPQ